MYKEYKVKLDTLYNKIRCNFCMYSFFLFFFRIFKIKVFQLFYNPSK